MKMRINYLLATLFVILLAACGISGSNGVDAKNTPAKNMRAGNADAIDVQTLSQPCTSCHGAKGASAKNPEWPNLAGQKAGYLADQVRAIRDGVRLAPTVLPFVKDLSDEEVEALADYFSGLPPPGNPPAENLNSAGERVRSQCISCHGVQGVTVNSEWPNLAGQHQEYLQKQLHAYRDGSRHAPLMNMIAKDLSDQQIKDVAEYYSQLSY